MPDGCSPTGITLTTFPLAKSTRDTLPRSAIPRASIRTRPARGSQHCAAARSPLAGLEPPRFVTYAVEPSCAITAPTGSTPSGMVLMTAPVPASSTANASFAGSATTATRRPDAFTVRATAVAPARKSPSATDDTTTAALSPAAPVRRTRPSGEYVNNWMNDFARGRGGPPGVRLSARSAGSRPTVETNPRPGAGSTATPYTPGRPSSRELATTRLSRHASRYTAPGTATQISPGDLPNLTPPTRPSNTLCMPAGVTRWSVAMTPASGISRTGRFGGCCADCRRKATWRIIRNQAGGGESRGEGGVQRGGGGGEGGGG